MGGWVRQGGNACGGGAGDGAACARGWLGGERGSLHTPPLLPVANPLTPHPLHTHTTRWSWYFATLLISCAMALVLLAPMTNLRSHVQRTERDARLAAKAAKKLA